MLIANPKYLKNNIYDLVVVGTGPAGTAIVDSFKKTNKRVLILEAGFKNFQDESQEIYNGTKTGFPHGDLQTWRKRQLGGSSNCWGGACVPYDEIDFLIKYNQRNYWPISLKELAPYYKEAGKFYGIGDYYNTNNPPILFKNKINKIRQSYWLVNDKKKEFKYKINDILKSSENIDLCLQANVFDLHFLENGSTIDYIKVEDYRGLKKKIFSKKFIICCGGIESTRLLLNWSEKYKQLNDIKTNLGYYYSPHINLNCGKLITSPNQIVNSEYVDIDSNISSLPFFSYSFDANDQDKFLNSKWTISKKLSVFNKKKFLKYLVTGDVTLKQNIQKSSSKEKLINELMLQYLSINNKKGDIYNLNVAFDQTPTRESCIKLINERDKFNLKKVNLNYHISNNDIRKVKNTIYEVANLLVLNNIGRVKMADIDLNLKEDEIGRSHHTGTIRMSTDATFGCVDSNLKIFGVDNLWICSAAVFPTPSHANPTFTIMALAKRLSNHIKNEIK